MDFNVGPEFYRPIELPLSTEAAMNDSDLSSSTSEDGLVQLAITWEKETRNISSIDEMTEHWAYQIILSKGKAVIPLLLRRLEQGSGYWFPALRQLNSGFAPYTDEDRGNYKKMKAAWISWGKANAQTKASKARDQRSGYVLRGLSVASKKYQSVEPSRC